MSFSRQSSLCESIKSLDQVIHPINFEQPEKGPRGRQELERKLLRKIDVRMSILVLIYTINYMDRSNVAVARLRGFEHDLHLQGQQFATLLSVLYIGYMMTQIPSNMFLSRIGRPSLYLPGCMMIWGALAIITGITTNFIDALLTRFALGFVEASFLPGALFLLSKWYKRDELGWRIAILYSGVMLSTAFGSLIGSGILNGMDGKLGRAAWRWLFYIEGALTIFVGFCATFVLPDFPSTTRWLSDEERELALKRMEEDAGVGDEEETEANGYVAGLKAAVADWSVWLLAMGSASQNVALSFNAYFPTLCATMGFGPTVTLLLCAPPFIYAGVMSPIISRHSGKTSERFYHACVPLLGGVVACIISISTLNTAARYFSFFLMAQSYAGYVVFYSWVSNSFLRPASKRAVVLALVNSFGQLGSIAGSYIWPSMWKPAYRESYAICVAAGSCMITVCLVFRLHLARLNRTLEEQEEAMGVEEKGFRYLL